MWRQRKSVIADKNTEVMMRDTMCQWCKCRAKVQDRGNQIRERVKQTTGQRLELSLNDKCRLKIGLNRGKHTGRRKQLVAENRSSSSRSSSSNRKKKQQLVEAQW